MHIKQIIFVGNNRKPLWTMPRGRHVWSPIPAGFGTSFLCRCASVCPILPGRGSTGKKTEKSSTWKAFGPVEGRWLLEARWTAMTNHWAVPLTQEMTDWLVRNITRKAAHVIEVGWDVSTHVVFVMFERVRISASATSSLGGWDWPCRNM